MTEQQWQQLAADLKEMGLTAEEKWRTPIGRYLALLLQWNSKMNLTAIRDPDRCVSDHFADSLALLLAVPANTQTVLDVGTGAGFPGAVLAAVRPDLQVTLVESIQKKCTFLSMIRRELNLTNCTVLNSRIESLQSQHGTFDLVVSRAAIPLPGWFDVARPFCKAGGSIVAMEGLETSHLPAGGSRIQYPLGAKSRSLLVVAT